MPGSRTRSSSTGRADPLSRYAPQRGDRPRRYPDLHDHIRRLAQEGLLVVVDEPINKDTEMHPLVRWQFRGGIEEKNRKAFLFAQPTDGNGRRFDAAVLVAGLAASRDVYRVGMGMALDKIGPAWIRALGHPVKPRVVTRASCHEIVIRGKDLDAPGKGLDGLPVPISTPGWDNGPYLTAGHYITRDPETGVQNAGNYRGQIKDRRRLGMNPSLEIRPGIYLHWQKYKAMGKPLPCAVVVGAPPAVSYCAVQKMPESLDEIWVAGALAGAPINVVRAKTVDLLVPAEAEFVIEGYISTDELEPEAPFGESHGYVNLKEYNAYMDVTAITRRRNAVLTSFISQVTPSESSTIRRVAMEPVFLNYLQTTLGVRGVLRVSMHEPLTSVIALIAIQFRRDAPRTEIWRALYGAASLHRYAGKWIVAINEDIDPENSDALFWAMCYRTQPQFDVKILDNKDPGHGPKGPRAGGESAAVLIDATLKGIYAPVALPKREFMENARRIWERLGLGALKPEPPWHGYDLGYWPPELATEAALATKSAYFKTGAKAAKSRRRDVNMNTPISRPEQEAKASRGPRFEQDT
ncbi:MAG TPA: UbiD family decarboxylase [Burkholderiales bacterium]|nr:UbiD family decarboxylase [Burkholderiales bacterium]